MSVANASRVVAGLLLLGGCTTTPAVEGAGFSQLTPSAATRAFIVRNDQPFARQVAGHNRACQRSTACKKAETP